MKNTLEEMKKMINQVQHIIHKLEQAFNDSRWEDVEELIKLRRIASEQAMNANLPVELKNKIELLLLEIKQQDKRLLVKAKEIQEGASKELVKRNSQKKSLAAYKD